MQNNDLEGIRAIREFHSEAVKRISAYADDPGMRNSDSEYYRNRAKVHERFVETLDSVMSALCPGHGRETCAMCCWPVREVAIANIGMEKDGPKMPPASCRQRLAADGKPYPRSGCAVCGQLSPKWRECDALIANANE